MYTCGHVSMRSGAVDDREDRKEYVERLERYRK